MCCFRFFSYSRFTTLRTIWIN